jgi:LacI family transcriptional regulator
VAEDETRRPSVTRRATINDVADKANVSKKTVSRVINREPSVKPVMVERVNRAIAELHFSPNPQARSLALGRSFLVGLIYENPSPTYVVNMQLGILDVLRPAGMELVVHPCRRDTESLLDDVRTFIERQRLDGVILPPPLSEDERLVALLRETGCPYVRIACTALDDPTVMVVSNDHLGARQAAKRLTGLGHTRIALVRGPTSYRSSRERGQAFIAALAEHGIVISGDYDIEGGYTFESGVAAGHRLLELAHPPTSVFALNDDMAIGVMQAARERELNLPRDLSVIGFDDLPMAGRVWPNLTSVRLPIRDMGSLASNKLLAQLGHDVSIDDYLIEPTLIARQSDIDLTF